MTDNLLKEIQRTIFADGKGTLYDFGNEESWVITRKGHAVCLNLARPITRWRRFRAWLDWPEKDSMILTEGGGARRVSIAPKDEEDA